MWIYCEEIVWSTGASTITFRRFHRKQACLQWFGYNLIQDGSSYATLTKARLHRILHDRQASSRLHSEGQQQGQCLTGTRTIYFFAASKRTARRENLQPPATISHKLLKAHVLLR